MAEIKVTYRGVPVPDSVGSFTEYEGFESWKQGVDSALSMTQGEAEEAPAYEPVYRYFHDQDDTGYGWWRRAYNGSPVTTDERWSEANEWGWEDGFSALNIARMVGGREPAWVEVPFEQVPQEIE